MNSIPKYFFHKTKYGEELLIDILELRDIKKYLSNNPTHYLSYYDVTLITEGEGIFRIDDKNYYVKPADIVFTLPNQFREWDTKNIINGYALIFEESFLLSFFNDSDFLNKISYLDKTKQRSLRLSLSNQEFLKISTLIQETKAEIQDQAIKDNHILRSIFYQILKYLDRIYISNNELHGVFTKNRHVVKFIEIVNIDYHIFHSVEHYADKLCITPNYLNELVKKETGSTAKQIIQNKLLHEAKKLLLYTKLSVTEIADKLHFESTSYFIRFIRKYEGKTPLQFRNKENL